MVWIDALFLSFFILFFPSAVIYAVVKLKNKKEPKTGNDAFQESRGRD